MKEINTSNAPFSIILSELGVLVDPRTFFVIILMEGMTRARAKKTRTKLLTIWRIIEEISEFSKTS
jgi:hypothetical protein